VSAALPLSLYVHFPWCVRKCPYCDFNSHAAGAGLPLQEYIDCLIADLDAELQALAAPPGRLESIFLGGGTPSLFPDAAIGRLLDAVDARLPLPTEVTLEANPGTVDAAHFRGYRRAGVSRLSIGAQSFDDASLRSLGRVHDAAQARQAIDTAMDAGFGDINVDLMYALPGQQPAGAVADLETAIAHGVAHVSWYQLTIEPNTQFHRAPPPLPDEDTVAAIEAAGSRVLRAAGFERYEVSAWTRGGRQCRHNVNYWSFGDYVGIGAGAHGKVSHHVTAGPDAGGLDILRYQKSRAPHHYLRDAGRRQVSAVAAAARPLEFMLNALRLTHGVDAALFTARTGLPWRVVAPTVARLRASGLLAPAGATAGPGRLVTTELGLRHLDSVVAAFDDAPEAQVADDVAEA
jgi:oxygen-independent coproporphyrinogen-3 oxidase